MVFNAIQKMAETNIGALLVMEGEQLVGIFSERDYARKGILQDRKSQKTPVREIMTSGKLITINPTTSLSEMIELTSRHHIRHLPVMDGERVVGMLSIGDIVNAIILEQQAEIRMLENYVF